ncbi:MAG: MBL fold metallo-hydrolase [Lachnospiraceae bacterium]|nr:MBL fold metallo-hydrolase [Lachnospiraceae bacterium]
MTENITVFTQNSIRIVFDQKTVYFDPFKMKEETHDADVIFVTHDHYDHFSPDDIAMVACAKTILVVPKNMEKKAHSIDRLVDRIVTVKVNDAADIDGLNIETVPAYNIMKPFHPKSAGNVGYIITAGGKRIYIAGDTDATKEAKGVKCDIALIPIGGTYTMDSKQAAELINAIKPEVAIPTHFGSAVGKMSDADDFAKLVDPSVKVENIIQG